MGTYFLPLCTHIKEYNNYNNKKPYAYPISTQCCLHLHLSQLTQIILSSIHTSTSRETNQIIKNSIKKMKVHTFPIPQTLRHHYTGTSKSNLQFQHNMRNQWN